MTNMPDYRNPAWQDCDKAFAQPGGGIQQMPGWQRVWSQRWSNTDYSGGEFISTSPGVTQIKVGSQYFERQNNGCVIVGADPLSGAVTGVAQFSGGINGTKWVGMAAPYFDTSLGNLLYTLQDQSATNGDYLVKIVGTNGVLQTPIYGLSTGLNGITFSGTYSGRTNKPFWIRITTAGTPDRFRWAQADTMPAPGSPLWSAEINVSTAPILLGLGVSVFWSASTGHTLGAGWLLPVGFSDAYTVSSDNGLTLKSVSESYAYSPTLNFTKTVFFANHGTQTNFKYLGFSNLKGNYSAAVWRFRVGGNPTLVANLNRVNTFEPVQFAGNSKGTLYAVPYDRVGVHDGRRNGPAGLLPPAIAPVAVGLIDEASTADLGDIQSSTWSSEADGVVVTTSTEFFARGTKSQKIVIPRSQRKGRIILASRDLGTPVVLTSANKRIRLIMQATTRRGRINKNIFSILLASATGLGGDVIEIPVNKKLNRDKFDELDFPWTHGSQTIASVGIKLVGSLEGEAFTKVSSTDATQTGTVTLYIGDLYADKVVPPPVSSTFVSGLWNFKVCGLQSSTGRLTAPSPASADVQVNETGVRIDCSGFFAQMPAGLANTFPGCDAVVVFAGSDDFAKDPRLGNGESFYRLSPPGGHLLSEIVLKPVPASDNTGTAEFLGLVAIGEVTSQVWTLTCNHTDVNPLLNTFLVNGSVSGNQGDFTADGTDLFSFSDPLGGTLSFTILATTAFAEGDTITFNSGPIVTFTDEISVEALADANNMLDPFYNELPPTGQILIPDGDRVVSLSRPPFTVGSASWTSGSRIVEVSAVIGDWAQGRFITAAGSDTYYKIIKVLTPPDSATSRLYIGRFDQATASFEDPYDGPTYTGAYSIVGDMTDMRWTNVTSLFGVDPQASSPLNTLPIMTGGNTIVSGGKAGPYLWVFGRDNSFVLQQNTNALDDIPLNGVAYANPYHVPNIGAGSPRGVVPTPDGGLLVLGPRAQLWKISGNSAEKHPASDNFSSIVNGFGGIINTEKMDSAFGTIVYKSGRAQAFFVFQHERVASGASALGDDAFYGPGVVGKSRELYVMGDEIVPGWPSGGQDSCWTSSVVGSTSPYGDPFFIDMTGFFGSFGGGEQCTPGGSSYEGGDIQQFYIGFMIDLETGIITAASGVPFTCAQGAAGGLSCAPQGQLQGAAYFGDTSGYIGFMDETLLSWGSPFNRFQFHPGRRIVREIEYHLDGGSNGFVTQPAVYVASGAVTAYSFTVTYKTTHWEIDDAGGTWPVQPQTGVMYSATHSGKTIQFKIFNGDNGVPFAFNDFFVVDTAVYELPTDGHSAVLDGAILPIDNDGNGVLPGLVLCKLSEDNAKEYRKIESNSINTVQLESTGSVWANDPVSTDVYIIGPLDLFVRPFERRTDFLNSVQSLDMNFQCTRSTPTDADAVDMATRITIDVFAAPGVENTLDLQAAATDTYEFDEEDLKSGLGTLYIAPVTSKAVAMGFTLTGPQTGPISFMNPLETEGTAAGVNDR